MLSFGQILLTLDYSRTTKLKALFTGVVPKSINAEALKITAAFLCIHLWKCGILFSVCELYTSKLGHNGGLRTRVSRCQSIQDDLC